MNEWGFGLEQHRVFPGSSAGKESACSAGDTTLLPGLVRFPGEGTGYSLQCSRLENSMDEEPGRLHSTGCEESGTTE